MQAATNVGDGGPLLNDCNPGSQVGPTNDLRSDEPGDLIKALRYEQNVRRLCVLVRLHPRLTKQLPFETKERVSRAFNYGVVTRGTIAKRLTRS